eukprot:7245898-Prymnesium_polylepis.1
MDPRCGTRGGGGGGGGGALQLPRDDELRELHGQLAVVDGAVGREANAVERVDHLRHKLGGGGEEERGVAHDELPDVDELRQRVALLDNDLLGPLDPRGVLMVSGGQPLGERGREDVERLLDEGARVRLEGAQQRDVDLQDDLGRRVVDLDEAAQG